MHLSKPLTMALLAACVACREPRQASVWSFRTDVPWLAGDSHAFTPVVDRESVFFCGGYFWDDADVIHALSLRDGRVVWKYQVGKCGGDPWLVAGTLVVHFRESRYGPCVFQGFDPATGTVRWRGVFQKDVPLTISKCRIEQAVAGDSIVFAFEGEQDVHAVRAADGTFERFTFPVEPRRGERVWLTASGSDAWFGFGAHVWRWRDGRSQPAEAIGLSSDASSPWYAATIGTRLFLGGRSPGSLRAFDLTTGRMRWERTGLPAIYSLSADDDALYVNMWRKRFELVAVDPNTGQERWTAGAGAGGFHLPMKKDGRLYADGWFSVLVVDAASGTIVRSVKAEDEVTTMPVRAGDLLLFGTINGALHAVRADE